MRSLTILCITLTQLLAGCALGTWIVGDADTAAANARRSADDGYSAYFDAFDNPWVGRSRDDLVAAFGPPDAMYEARPRFADYEAGIPAVTYVYTRSMETAGRCIDAYVVDTMTSTVIKYFCR